MGVEFRAKVFKNGRSRAVRIPVGIDLPGDEVVFRQEGGQVVIEPVEQARSSLAEWFATLEPLPPDDRFEPVEDYPPEPVDF